MSSSITQAVQSMFASRLETLSHLVKRAEEGFPGSTGFLERRIAPDMANFGTQVAYTCNQPRNFALWMQGKPADNLDANVATLEQAHGCIRGTQELLSAVRMDDARLAASTRVDLGPTMYAQMTGAQYVNDFLVPNFYFHLVTAYDILRMAGLDLGKRDFMLHLLPLVRQA